MPTEPPEAPKIGPPDWIDWARKISAAIVANRPISGLGVLVSDATGGRSINATPGSAGPPPVFRPFQLASASDEEGAKVRVYASSIDGQLPTGFSPGDVPPYLLSVSGTGVVYGIFTIDETTGERTSVSVGSSATLPSNTSTTFHCLIGSFSETDGAVTVSNVRYGPILVSVCGGFDNVWIVNFT